jgi:hypothetical protein
MKEEKRMGINTCQKDQDYLDTTDIDLTACAVLNGHSLLDAYLSSDRVVFCFKNTLGLQKMVDRYMRGELLVEPTSFLRIYRSMKNQIFRLREGGQSNKVAGA